MDPYIELDMDRGRIFLFVDYEPGINIRCKAVRGYKWEPDYDRKPWSYPLRMETCHALRAEWGQSMIIGPRLTKWARAEAARASQLKQMAKMKDSELERVAELYPAFWQAMSVRPYQRSGADFMAHVGTAANFDEPGLGKTATALAAIMQAEQWDGPSLVICPKTAMFPTWVKEIQKWTDGRAYGMPDGRARREEVLWRFMEDNRPGARFLIVHPNMIQIKYGDWCNQCGMWVDDNVDVPREHYTSDRHKEKAKIKSAPWPELFEEKFWNAIVADECHKYLLKLRPNTGRKHTSQPQWAHGMRALIGATKTNGLRFPMTGTPFRGREMNLFGILHWMDPKTYSSFWNWAETYLYVGEEEHRAKGGGTGSHKVVGGLKPDMEEKFYDVLDTFCLRRTKVEVRKELPAMDVQQHWVQLEGEHKRQYEEFADQGVAELESGVVEQLGVLSEITRMRQFAFGPMDVEVNEVLRKPTRAFVKWCRDAGIDVPEKMKLRELKLKPIIQESPKVQLVLDMLETRGAFGEFSSGDRKFVIASQWTSFIDAFDGLLQDMKVPTLKITGGVTGKRRDQAVDVFSQPGGPRIMLLNTTAGGTSLTLDAFCDEMFVLDETWVYDDFKQLVGRIDNRGQEIRPRTVHLIRTADTVEEGIANQNNDQYEMQNRILDARRGVEVALSLLRRTE